jgi:hypothetical protein
MSPLVRRIVPSVVLTSLLLVAGLSAPGAAGRTRDLDARLPSDTDLRGDRVSRGAGRESAARSASDVDAPALSPVPADRLARAKARSGDRGSIPGDRGARTTPGPLAIGHVGGAGFDGVPDLHGFSPSDSTGALGDSWFMGAVNSDVAVYDTTGVNQTGNIRLRTLAPSLPNQARDFDPKVIYDHYDDQFVLVFLAADRLPNANTVWIVITTAPDATADDEATWCTTRINGDQVARDGHQLADYPSVGFTEDRVTISSNQFPSFVDPGYDYAQLISIPKGDLYDCAGGVSGKVFSGDQTRAPDGSKGFTIQPAQTYGGSTPQVQYLLSFDIDFRQLSGEKLIVWRIKKTNNGIKLAKAQKNVGNADIPPFGTQKGGSGSSPNTWWDTGDLRLINSSYDADADRLYGAHAVLRDIGDPSYPESSIRWYEVDPASDLSTSQVPRQGILGVEDRDQGWPAVVSDAAGNLFITYSQAGVPGAGEYLSGYAVEIAPGSTTEGTPLLLVSGESRYEFSPQSPERWGDYNAIGRDPDSSRIAIANQYAIADAGDSCGDGASRTCLWQQWIDLVQDV